MPTEFTLDDIINHDIYADGTINGYALPSTTARVKKVFHKGDLIGNIYSAVMRDDGPWYMIYLNNADFNNMQPTWVKHDIDKISLPDKEAILQAIQEKAEQDDIAKNGLFAHYLKKYLPWVVGGVVVAVAAPALLNSGRKNVSGMTPDEKNLAGLAATAGIVYLLTRKHRKAGPLIIGDPYDGTFPDPVTGELPPLNPPQLDPAADYAGGGQSAGYQPANGSAGRIQFIGPFEVGYNNDQPGIMAGGRICLGKQKTF